MSIRTGAVALASTLLLFASACGKSTMPGIESNTNWLQVCGEDADCEQGSECLCGTCTKACDAESECGVVSASAECIATSELAESCGGGEPEKICAVPCADADTCGDLRCNAGRCVAQATPASDDEPPVAVEGPACQLGGVVAEIAVTNVDKVDLLFVLDDSPTMAPVYEQLRTQVSDMVRTLTSGQRQDAMGNPAGAPFPPVNDLHVGVITSDMGAVGVSGIEGCDGFGGDGLFEFSPGLGAEGCETGPDFLSYRIDGAQTPDMFAKEIACRMYLGGDGCSYTQPLEAGLKALWPAIDVDPNTGQQWIDPQTGQPSNRITFLRDAMGNGGFGHGDGRNANFLRNDASTGLSLISVVVLTNHDDCSSQTTAHMTPVDSLDPSDPLVSQPQALRCHYNQQNLYRIERYVQGLRALRPGNENLVQFSLIGGVPPDLVSPEVLANYDLDDSASRDAFYAQVLDDARMQETIDPATGDQLMPSCSTDGIKAYPPRRLLEVVRGFGGNGAVGSLCGGGLRGALDNIINLTAKQLGAVCLPRTLARKPDGTVACDVVWELPLPNTAPVTTPTSCAAEDFLSPAGEATTPDGRARCKVSQLATKSGAAPSEQVGGWYYDDFSNDVMRDCNGGGKQRIAFTVPALPPTGVTVQLECELAQQQGLHAECVDDAGCEDGLVCIDGACALEGGYCPPPQTNAGSRVGDACLPELIPEGGFDEREAYLETGNPDCGGNVCLVYELRGDPREGCVPSPSDEQETVCADPADTEKRIYCSCRCDGPEGTQGLCDCPDGFSCVPILRTGAPQAGSYCVQEYTLNR